MNSKIMKKIPRWLVALILSCSIIFSTSLMLYKKNRSKTFKNEASKNHNTYSTLKSVITLVATIKECSQKTDSLKWGQLKLSFDNLNNQFNNIKNKINKTEDITPWIEMLIKTTENFQECAGIMMELSNFIKVYDLSGYISETDKKNLSTLLNRKSIAEAKMLLDMKSFPITIGVFCGIFLKDLSLNEKKIINSIFKNNFNHVINEYLKKKSKNKKVLMKQSDWAVIYMREALLEKSHNNKS